MKKSMHSEMEAAMRQGLRFRDHVGSRKTLLGYTCIPHPCSVFGPWVQGSECRALLLFGAKSVGVCDFSFFEGFGFRISGAGLGVRISGASLRAWIEGIGDSG